MEVILKMAEKNFKVILTLPERLKEPLKSIAEKKALTVNALIRTVVAEYLEQEAKQNK
jgi:predicted DNA-binding ribbon-helix-helix protein